MKATESTYLVIPFEQLKEAKRQAGKLDNGENALEFDPDRKMWFAKEGSELDKLTRWRIDNTLATETNNDSAQEFGDFIRSLGGNLQGDPEMDGLTHRISMNDDKQGKKSGVYVGHLDGFANGWFADHRDGHRNTWSSNSDRPDPIVLAHRKAMAAQEQLRRDARIRQEQDKKSVEVTKLYERLSQASQDHPYLKKKGVKVAKGMLIDDRNQLVIPLLNVAGDIRTLQTIAPDGSKRLSKGGQKEGNFFIVGGTLKNGQPIVFAEGYATAASGAMALKYPVVMTVDSGNLVKVAKALHERYPDSPTLFLADDDLPKPKRPGNPGKEKATEAAELTGGIVILPAFTAAEREKGLTDFNDFHQSRGLSALAEQLAPVFAPLHRPSHLEPTTMENTQTEPTPEIDIPSVQDVPVNEYADYGHIADSVFDQEVQDFTPYAINDPIPPVTAEQTVIQEAPLATEQIVIPETPTAVKNEAEEAKQENIAPIANPTIPTATAPKEKPIELVSFAGRLAPQPATSTPNEQQAQSEANLAAQTEDAICIEMPAGQARQVAPLDLDALMQQITHEMALDGRSVKYLFSGEPAFVDHGDRITMANAAASQSDAMILTALLVSREQYRGRIELTGSDQFKHRAIMLIAEYNLDVKMKNPQQQLMLDEARKQLADEPTPGAEATPVGPQTASIMTEGQTTEPATATATATATSSPLANELPPELRPTVLPPEIPRNASRKESEAGLTGALLGHGPAPYNFDSSENLSYYVHLRTAHGERYVWGKELAQVMPDSGLSKNDVVTLTWLGSKEVTVQAKVRDANNKIVVNKNGVEQTEEIISHRNQWAIKPAVDPQLLVSHEQQTTPPASLTAYDMTHFFALQQQVVELAAKAGVSLPPLPAQANDLVWFKPNGQGTAAPATRPATTPLPAQTQDAGTVLMKTMTAENQLKLLLVKGLGDYVQGVVQYEGEYHPVLGKLCINDKGTRYVALNAVTADGIKSIGHGNAINHAEGANNAFVFRLQGEKDKLYATLVEPAKCPPALHKQLGFTHDYIPPSQAPQSRDNHTVENRINPAPQAPRPGL
ncbi:LPD7 domain-containing protein [Yersinia enterocolitica]